MIPPQQQPDIAGAVLALDQAMIALAVAKSTLLGETSRPVDLAAAEASPANPYGSTLRTPQIIPVQPPRESVLAKLRGRPHYAEPASAGSCPACESPSRLLRGGYEDEDGVHPCVDPWHDATSHLTPDAGYQLPSASIPPQEIS